MDFLTRDLIPTNFRLSVCHLFDLYYKIPFLEFPSRRTTSVDVNSVLSPSPPPVLSFLYGE